MPATINLPNGGLTGFIVGVKVLFAFGRQCIEGRVVESGAFGQDPLGKGRRKLGKELQSLAQDHLHGVV